MKNNRNLIIIALIALVNSIGYGIIIPILEGYTSRFGLSDFQFGLLFALFSLCQFVATPVIGRLSDKYGRKPLLVISLIGTAVSFFMMAFAKNVEVVFLARALDGITAGNIPVAAAVISDTTEIKDRSKGFAVFGAAFGFGFVFGPAISAFTVGISQAFPFIIAGIISLLAVFATMFFLPETNKYIGQVRSGKLFDFKALLHAIRDKNVGKTFLITLFYFLAFGILISRFQPFARKVLMLSEQEISIIFMIFGLVGLITQLFLLHKITNKFGLKKSYSTMFILIAISFAGFFFTRNPTVFVMLSILLGFANAAINPLTQTILSRETDEKSQGTMQGLNTSYMSIGNIVGPLIAGFLATYNVSLPFLACSLLCVICFYLSFHILSPHVKKESAF